MWNGRWLRTREQGLILGKGSPRKKKGPIDFQHWKFLSEKGAKLARRRSFLLKRLCSVATIYGLNRFYWKLCFEPNPIFFRPLDFSDSMPPKETYFRRAYTATLR